MEQPTSPERAPLALYRKYRPSAFDEVRGQDHIVSVLRAAVEGHKLAHAYLFAGGRGTGKTSMARILARAVGTSEKDIYEMDAASNRGIDEIRELRESVSTLPFESTYKFYIIDEAHALTPAAWGAFLKTLEEPPSHVLFVLATTELDRVPDTIRSRCQVFQFKKPPQGILKKLVLDVAAKEGMQLSPAGAELVALMGDSSYRDTLGIVQKVFTLAQGKILTADAVAAAVGAPQAGVVNACIDALARRDIGGALTTIHRALAGGTEARVFTLLLIAKVRAVLLLRFAPTMKGQIAEQFSEADVVWLEGLSGPSGAALNSKLLSELITAVLEMYRAPVPALPLELALYRVFGE